MSSKPVTEGTDHPTTEAGRPAAEKDCEQHREDLLDSALKESFPASDPPSIARPAGKGC